MRGTIGWVLGLGLGFGSGVLVAVLVLGQKPATVAIAGSNDRHEDYVMATGAVNINPKLQTDGVWLLDYKSGKLLGSVIDKAQGKMIGWTEVDLVSEFDVAPKQDVHFLMTTGWISAGQSALYIAETTTGKFGVYTRGLAPTGTGIIIRRHDLASFRANRPAAPAPVMPAGPAEKLPLNVPNPLVPGGGLPAVPKIGEEPKK